jgi:hypothetical protein
MNRESNMSEGPLKEWLSASSIRVPGREQTIRLIGLMVWGALSGAVILASVAMLYFYLGGGFPSASDAALWGLTWGPIWGILLAVFSRTATDPSIGLGTMIGLLYGSVPAAMHMGVLGQWWPHRITALAIVGPMLAGIVAGAVFDRLADVIARMAVPKEPHSFQAIQTKQRGKS